MCEVILVVMCGVPRDETHMMLVYKNKVHFFSLDAMVGGWWLETIAWNVKMQIR